MKYILTSLLFCAAPGLVLACIDQGCGTIDKFVGSYVNAVVENNKELIKRHYYDNDYACYIDKFYVNGEYSNFNVQEKSKLESEAWDEFELVQKSEATKIKLFYEYKKKYPNKKNREIMSSVYKELMKIETKRVDVPFKVKPEYRLDLNINGKLHHNNHPCFSYTGISDSLYLVNTKKGFKAVEPMCDVGRAVGKNRINKENKDDDAEEVLSSLSSDQINHYKELLDDGRMSTVSQFSKDLSVDISLAKEVVLNKICYLIP